MKDLIIEINGMDYVQVEGLFTKILDWLIDGTSEYYIYSWSDKIADEIGSFLSENGCGGKAVGFKKLYLQRRFGKNLLNDKE